MYRKIRQISLRKNNGKVANDYLTQTQASLEFKNKINCDIIKKYIKECPQEWRPTQENENMLIEYLMYRINHIDVIIATILNYIK